MRAVIGSGLIAGVGIISTGSIVMNEMIDAATESNFQEVENRIAILDRMLARAELDAADAGHAAIRRLIERYPSMDAARSAGTCALRDAADELGVGEIYFIGADGVIRATSFAPDLGLDLFSLGPGFAGFLRSVFGSGRFADQRLSMSTLTSRANSYQYYGPIGADYIIEVSTSLDEAVPRGFQGLGFTELIRLLFNQVDESARPLVRTTDFIWGNEPPYRSFIDQRAIGDDLARLVERAAAGESNSSTRGSKRTIVRRLSLSRAGFDYVDKGVYAVLVVDHSYARAFTVASASVSLTLIGLTIAASFLLAKGSFDRHVTCRLEALESAMDRIGSGDADARLDDGEGDEIASIGRSAEGMVAQIRERNAELSSLARKLEEKVSEGARREDALKETLEANQSLVHEMDHRVKNNMQFAMSMASMQGRRVDSADARQALERLRSRLGVVSMVQDHALKAPYRPRVRMAEFFADVCADVAGSFDRQISRIRRVIDAGDIELDAQAAVATGLIVAELVDNAYRHAFADAGEGVLSITMRLGGPAAADGYSVTVRDDGKGEPRGGGVGLELAGALATQLGGRLSWESADGTRVTLVIPPARLTSSPVGGTIAP